MNTVIELLEAEIRTLAAQLSVEIDSKEITRLTDAIYNLSNALYWATRPPTRVN